MLIDTMILQWERSSSVIERATDDREVPGSNLTGAAIGNYVYPTFPVSFGRDTKSRWSLLSGIYARGSKIFHTGGKCVACRELDHS